MYKKLITNDVEIQYVKSCFLSYQYHKKRIDWIQSKLSDISEELSSGGINGAGLEMKSGVNNNSSPWQLELITREACLIAEQDRHLEAIDLVDGWLNKIKNPLAREVMKKYAIENGFNNALEVGEKIGYSESSVKQISKRIIYRIALST